MARNRSTFGRVLRRKRHGVYAPGFYVRVRLHGKEVTRWAGPDRKIANEFLANLLRKSAREDLLGERAIGSVTFEEFKPTLLAWFEARHGASTVEAEKPRVERIARHFGTRPLREVTAENVTDFLTGLVADRRRGKETAARPASNGTRNRYLSTLAVAFRLAVERGYARENPAKGIPRSKEAKKSVPFLTTADVERLIATGTDVRERALYRLLADSGLRRAEAARLEWRDVDLRRGALVVRKSKSGKPRDLPLTKAAVEAIKALRETRGAIPLRDAPDLLWPEYATPAALDRLSWNFRRRARRAGIAGVSLHGLRHGFCSRLAQAGVPLPTIAVLAGHESIVTTMRYAAHLPGGATLDAIRLLDPVVPAAPKVATGNG